MVTGLGFVAFGALLMTWLLRSATVVAEAGIEVRGMFRSRVYAWRSVVDIQESPLGGAVLYDRDLRQVELPYLGRKRLGAEFLPS